VFFLFYFGLACSYDAPCSYMSLLAGVCRNIRQKMVDAS